MEELYRAEDGTLRRRGIPEEHNTPQPTPHTSENIGRRMLFIMYCVFITIALGGALYTCFAEGNADEGFFASVMPVAMIVGAGLGCLIYGCSSAAERCYDLGAFFFATLAAGAGAMIVFWILSLVPLLLSSLAYFFIAILLIGIFCGAIGG